MPSCPARTSRKSALRSGLHAAKPCATSRLHRLDRGIDLLARIHLGTAPQGCIAQFGIELLQWESTNHFLFQQPVVNAMRIFFRLHDEFVEAPRGRKQYLCFLSELSGCVIRFREILFRAFFEALAT